MMRQTALRRLVCFIERFSVVREATAPDRVGLSLSSRAEGARESALSFKLFYKKNILVDRDAHSADSSWASGVDRTAPGAAVI
ncbi:hypothetical protein [Methylobacterium aquaticum]|jgi:hypothetical protein|uniref:hypothetical protein n=1 Tax=Methylobacterium aquaticum TaxID=270351 RepID=UPI0012E10EAA|nr:hypothetical protein [Methylobacterium aquaticum]